MVFVFQQTTMHGQQAKPKLPFKLETKKVDLAPLIKEFDTIDGYYSNDLTTKNKKSPESNLPTLFEKKQVSNVAKFCVFYNVAMGAQEGNGVSTALKKDGQFNVNMNNLRDKIVKDYNTYFPEQPETCKNYVDKVIMPYVKNELSINK